MGKDKWGIGLPVSFVQRTAKRRPQVGREASFTGAARQLLQQRRHVRDYGHEHLRILECETQCAIASHGNATDGTSGASVEQAEMFFHLRDEVTDKEVLVLHACAF